MTRLSRRQLLVLAASACALTACRGLTSDRPLVDIIPDAARARRFGASAIDQIGTFDAPAAAADLDLELRRGAVLVNDVDRFVGSYAATIADEFRQGDTLVVDGWVVPRSEAVLGALLAA